MTNKVFLLEHAYTKNDGIEEIERIGVYASRTDALAAIDRLRTREGFRDYPDNFVIADYVVDSDRWPEGYTE